MRRIQSLKETHSATLVGEPIVACFNHPQCNTHSEDDDEWVINDNISFDYPVSVELFKFVTNSSLRMHLYKPSTSSTSVECIEGSVLVFLRSKRVNHQ